MTGLPLEGYDKPVAEKLPPYAGCDATAHVFEPREVDAVNLALLSRRPLLLRGEPGTGKSQLARAVAQKLERAFLRHTVDAQTEPSDLLYRFDAVARLARAQMLGALGAAAVSWTAQQPGGVAAQQPEPTLPRGLNLDARLQSELELARFVAPGLLWWAFDWDGAATQAKRVGKELQAERHDESQDHTRGTVLLVDEIDKADSAVPNGLLEALGNGSFAVPGCAKRVCAKKPASTLVVVTTNEERALPDAFLRRCVVLTLELRGSQADMEAFLARRGAVHYPEVPESLRQRAAELVAEARCHVRDSGLMPPGQAEYLDLLRALHEFLPSDGSKGPPGERQALAADLLERCATYVLNKHPPASFGGDGE